MIVCVSSLPVIGFSFLYFAANTLAIVMQSQLRYMRFFLNFSILFFGVILIYMRLRYNIADLYQ